VSSDGGVSRRQSIAEFGSRGDDSSIGHDIDVDDEDDDEERNTVSDEDSGREEWEGGKNKGVRRALRFAKTDTTWSEMRKRSEKRKWLQEKKERTRTSRWEELLKEQQETLKALQIHSCEIGAITSSAEVSFTSASDLSMSVEAVVPAPLSAASEGLQPEPSSAAAASGEPAQDKVQESDAAGGVQAYKTHQIRRLWFRRKYAHVCHVCLPCFEHTGRRTRTRMCARTANSVLTAQEHAAALTGGVERRVRGPEEGARRAGPAVA
jgi:phosphoglycolate phosphatase-like HAD superfamily hydrolase